MTGSVLLERPVPAVAGPGRSAAPSPVPRSPKPNRGRLTRAILVSPATLSVLVLGAFPLVFIVLAALSKSTLGKPFQAWVGTANLADALGNADVTGALVRSVGYGFGVALVSTGLGLAVALALAASVRAGSLVRTLLLLPMITPPLVVGILWKLIFNPSGGLVNTLAHAVGYSGPPISVLAEPAYALGGIALADIWEWTPLITLLIFAALLGRDAEVAEAAALDGAHGWRLFRFITWPAIAGTVLAAFLVRLVLAFKVFDLIYVMTAGGPGQATTLPAYQIYQAALQHFDIGAAAALTLLLAVVVTVVTLPVIALTRRYQS